MHPMEPTPGRWPSGSLALVGATCPAFLSITALGVLLGLSTAYYDLGRLENVPALLSLVFALFAHAGVNVINDY
jgi:1,4-dihydroxy-2-naphthoate polyprenyltransferase